MSTILYYFSLFFILYIPFQIALDPAEGIDLASARLLAIFIFLFWLILSLKNRKINFPDNLTAVLILSFLFLSAFSILFAENQVWAGKKMLFLLSFFPLYFVFSDLARSKGRAEKIVRFLTISGFAAALAALFQFGLQFAIGLDPALDLWRKIMPLFLGDTFSQSVFGYSSWLVNIGGATYFRAIAFFPDPHMLSLFLGLIFPWSVMAAIVKNKTGSKNSFFAWIIPAVILAADILTFSRGGYLGLIGGTVLISFWLLKKWPRKYLIAAGIFFILLVAVFSFSNPISKRLTTSFNLSEGSNQERLKNWNQAFQIIRTDPALGTGLGNYSLAVKPTASEREPIYAHNLFLDIAAETGLLNGMIFLLLILSSAYGFVRSAKYATFYLGGAWALSIFFFHSLFESGLYSVHVLPVLIITLALSASLSANVPKNN